MPRIDLAAPGLRGALSPAGSVTKSGGKPMAPSVRRMAGAVTAALVLASMTVPTADARQQAVERWCGRQCLHNPASSRARHRPQDQSAAAAGGGVAYQRCSTTGRWTVTSVRTGRRRRIATTPPGSGASCPRPLRSNPALAISGIDILNLWYYRPDYMAIMSNCANSRIGVWSANSLDRTVVVAVYGRPS